MRRLYTGTLFDKSMQVKLNSQMIYRKMFYLRHHLYQRSPLIQWENCCLISILVTFAICLFFMNPFLV